MIDLPNIQKAGDIQGKRVLLRSSLNVPVQNGQVVNDFRLLRSLETISFLREAGARTTIIGHRGRNSEETLAPIAEYLRRHIDISFIPSVVGDEVRKAVDGLSEGGVLLLENVRSDEREVENDESFAHELASYGEMYVNDAFAASHREHTSIVGIPSLLPHYGGLQFMREIEALAEAFNPPHPALFILGGAKFETKEPLIRKFLDVYDEVFVGGALGNDLFVAKGLEVGTSLVSGKEAGAVAVLEHPHLTLPLDVVVEGPGGRQVRNSDAVKSDEMILDEGPRSVENLLERARECAFVLWNGPLGNYEKGFAEGTEMLAKGLAALDTPCIVGGGDTVASIAKLNLLEQYQFVSTGGGAMLAYLQSGTLPGIEALKDK